MNPNHPNMNQNQNLQPQAHCPEFTHQNMQTGQVPAQYNHGGHEMFDIHEMLGGIVSTLIFIPFVRDMSKIQLCSMLTAQHKISHLFNSKGLRRARKKS